MPIASPVSALTFEIFILRTITFETSLIYRLMPVKARYHFCQSLKPYSHPCRLFTAITEVWVEVELTAARCTNDRLVRLYSNLGGSRNSALNHNDHLVR
jgi:hypothetical protein